MEETAELRQYLFIIRKWLWLIVLGILLAGGTAYVVSQNMTPIYRASTTLLISQGETPTLTTYQDILTSERIAQTYAELLRKRPILQGTAARLGLKERDAEELPFTIDIKPVRDTQLIELSVEGDDPYLASQAANTIPEVFIEQNEAIQSKRFASSKENLSHQMDRVEKDIERTEESIAQLKGSTSGADVAERTRLESLLAQYRSSYSSLLQSYEEVRLAETTSLDNVIVVEPAEVPTSPVKPRTRMNTLLAAVVGCMLAVGTAFLIEYLDDTIKSPTEIAELLGLSSLAAIPHIPGGELEDKLVPAEHPKSHISEAYRMLRTNIQFSSPDRPLKTLLITSPGPTEGKSLTVANLGVVMAQAGQRVILVDSDLRRPVLHRVFGLSKDSGLTSALFNEDSDIGHWLQSTQVENLSVLTSGPLPPNPSELLGSQRMERLIEKLKAHADVVLFDSPPSLAVTDAAVLTSWVDGTILVIDAGTTRRGLAQRARSELGKVGANVLGATLNRMSLDSGSGYYYYYYYYYYYSDEGEGRRKRRGRKSWRRRFIEGIPILGRRRKLD